MRHLRHLVRRFFGSFVSRRPAPAEQAWLAEILSAEERDAFWGQPVQDQHHSIRGARFIHARTSNRSDLVRAILLHDIGKRHARLGTFGRSVATGLDLLRIPLRGRFRCYMEHGRIGAEELERIGADRLVVAFARHHQHERPRDIRPADWDLLVAADGA